MKPAEIRRQTQQRRILAELRTGKNLSQAAKAAGITDRTLRNWRRINPAFERRVLEALAGKGTPAAGNDAAPAMPSSADWALRRDGTPDIASACPDGDEAYGGWDAAVGIMDDGGQDERWGRGDCDGVVPNVAETQAVERPGGAPGLEEADSIAVEAHDNADLWREWAEWYEAGNGTPEQAVEAWKEAAAWREHAHEAVPWEGFVGDPDGGPASMEGYSTPTEYRWSTACRERQRRGEEMLAAALAKQAAREAEAVRRQAVFAEIQAIEDEAAQRVAAVRQRGTEPIGTLQG